MNAIEGIVHTFHSIDEEIGREGLSAQSKVREPISDKMTLAFSSSIQWYPADISELKCQSHLLSHPPEPTSVIVWHSDNTKGHLLDSLLPVFFHSVLSTAPLSILFRIQHAPCQNLWQNQCSNEWGPSGYSIQKSPRSTTNLSFQALSMFSFESCVPLAPIMPSMTTLCLPRVSPLLSFNQKVLSTISGVENTELIQTDKVSVLSGVTF